MLNLNNQYALLSCKIDIMCSEDNSKTDFIEFQKTEIQWHKVCRELFGDDFFNETNEGELC